DGTAQTLQPAALALRVSDDLLAPHGASGQVGAEINGDDDVCAHIATQRNRYRINKSAIDEQASVALRRREQAGHGNRSAHSIGHRAFLQPDLATIGEISGDAGKGNLQRRKVLVEKMLAEEIDQLLALDQAA